LETLDDHIGITAVIDEASFIAFRALKSASAFSDRVTTHGINDFILVVCECIEVLRDRILLFTPFLIGTAVSFQHLR